MRREVARLLPLVDKLLAEVPRMRLFVALDLPWALRERLAMLSGSGIPGARWVPPENYHLTLRFIGETPRAPGRGYRPRTGRPARRAASR